MQFYSTNNKDLRVSFKDAVFNSLPADKGLYMPVTIPVLPKSFLDNLERLEFREIAFTIAAAFVGDEIPDEEFHAIIDDAINFEAPVKDLGNQQGVLELFHGPSLAFKDFGARFMSRVMSYFLKEGERELNVLVATSGDTGGAVALGFLGVPNTRVTILYPKGKVSLVQQLQLVTNGENIHAIEVDGTFDDCQALVKQAFNDPELNTKFRLTSANSINIARLIPQTFYYFNALAQIRRMGYKDMVVSVPSGNFGNLGAGLLAWKMGLPVAKFIAATNLNDTVPQFLSSGNYHPKPSVQTFSNAMDVGDPSNWVRIMDIFGSNVSELKQVLEAASYSDEETLQAINELFDSSNYVVCPHTAIAWRALKEWQSQNSDAQTYGVFLSTAHPCKFPDIFPENIKSAITIPDQVTALANKQKLVTELGKDYHNFQNYLSTNLR